MEQTAPHPVVVKESELSAQSDSGKQIDIAPVQVNQPQMATELPNTAVPSLDTASPPGEPPEQSGNQSQIDSLRPVEDILEDMRDLREDTNKAIALLDEYTKHGRSNDQLLTDLGIDPMNATELKQRFPELAQALIRRKNVEDLSPAEKDERIGGMLQDLGMPAEEIENVKVALNEGKLELPADEQERTEIVAAVERTKREFTTKEIAGIGMIVLLDLALNNGHGTSQLLERVMKNQVMPAFLGKLGLDQELIQSLLTHSHELGRGIFQMKKHDMVTFLSGMSGWEIADLLNSLDEHERAELLTHGRFESRGELFSQAEIKRYFIAPLNEKQREKLGISTR